MPNQNPEQLAQDRIDAALRLCGWTIQDKKKINLTAALGVAVREYQTDTGLAGYIVTVNRIPIRVIKAKRPEKGVILIEDFYSPIPVFYKCVSI